MISTKIKESFRGLFKTAYEKLVNTDNNFITNIIVKFPVKNSQNVKHLFDQLGSDLVNKLVSPRASKSS